MADDRSTIIREFPQYKHDQKKFISKPEKPQIITDEQFAMVDIVLMDASYLQWMSGINPDTRRKCKIGGNTYRRVGDAHHYPIGLIKQVQKIQDRDMYKLFRGKILAKYDEDMQKYNAEMSIEEQRHNMAKDQYKPYNDAVEQVIVKIRQLKWDESVEFDGKRYGIPAIIDHICHTLDCGGIIIETTEYESCSCHLCEDWSFSASCQDHTGTTRTTSIKCKKCGTEYLNTMQ